MGVVGFFVVVAAVIYFGSFLYTPPPPPPQKTPAEIRTERISAGFSILNGAHVGLEKYIKQHMHNPKSFEHVKTVYREEGDNLIVVMKYRGTNKFGAVVTNQVTAKADLDGNVTSILSQEN